jgi:tetratricopeptide (TPR) repeat protein
MEKITNMEVKVWKEKKVIPTYEIGDPELYPVFLEKRVYQASSGKVYPHPVIEHLSDKKVDKEWEVIFLENDYIKIMILPALGGRIQMAYDKIKERHFVYYNQVIKPALVGLTGPWISGGIEFNWPQHHRPSTYGQVDYSIETNPDGSKTVWVSEVERMFRTKGMAGFTVYPDKAYLEIKVKLYNRTPFPQTFLWWANPAVSVNDDYQSVFPPDVNAVFDHGKRDVSEFPIAKGKYYKVNYAPGTDISRYKNIPVPTSYMAITSKYDFVGGYDHKANAGLLHVANHHISPGKKQWTWGNGDFGKAWDRNLTDTDGPYIELMCGVYTDNQPDFSWLQPFEEKSFNQYFMPYHNVGLVKNATKDVIINLETKNQVAKITVYVTSTFKGARIDLKEGEKVIFSEKCDLSPTSGYQNQISVLNTDSTKLNLCIYNQVEKLLLSWSPSDDLVSSIPEPAKPAKLPNEIKSVEQLFLRGQHIEQYRHGTYSAIDYYQEALRREPGDIRTNNALGLWYLRCGRFQKAKTHFCKAIETLTQHNPNPYDSEAYFNLGLTYFYLNEKEEAFRNLYKSTWKSEWQDPAYLILARIAATKENYEEAFDLTEKALYKNWNNHMTRHLRVVLLRKMGDLQKARKLIEESLQLDAFNYGVLFEKYLLDKEEKDLSLLKKMMRGNQQTYLEYSIDYSHSGFYQEAIELLEVYINGRLDYYPMVAYFKAWCQEKSGQTEEAIISYKLAGRLKRDLCFPNRLEELIALKSATQKDPNNAAAYYYLGNYCYDKKQFELAKEYWEKSIDLENNFPITYRNLALLYFNKNGQKSKAKSYLEKALSLDKNEARLLMELDQLYRKANVALDDRFSLIEKNIHLVNRRDDLYLERVTLYNLKNEFAKALDLISKRKFHPWEGGEGKVSYQYITCHIQLAKQNMVNRKYTKAIKHLNQAQIYTENLGEGKLYGVQENDIFYYLGCAYNGLGEADQAKVFWEKASTGLREPGQAFFYNDQQPDKIFYQGLALSKLGNNSEAQDLFKSLINYGIDHIEDEVRLDYFAVSHPDLLIWDEDLSLKNKIHCHYLMGLGHLGLQDISKAEENFKNVLKLDLYHQPCRIHLDMTLESANIN